MSTLPEFRAELRAALTGAGLTAYEHLPPQLHPPVVLIEPADPYITDGSTEHGYGFHVVSFDLHVITRKGTGQTQTTELDELIQTVITATDETWDLGDVARPYRLQVGSTFYLASRVTVTIPNRF